MYCHESIIANKICYCYICKKNRYFWESDFFDPTAISIPKIWLLEKHYRNHLDDGDPVTDMFYTPDIGCGVKIVSKDSDT